MADSPVLEATSTTSTTSAAAEPRDPQQPRRGRITLAVATVAVAVIALVGWLLVPVTFQTGDSAVTSEPSWTRIPQAEATTVVVRHRGPGATKAGVSLTPPEYMAEALVTDSGGFTYNPAEQVWEARGPATMTIEGSFADLSVALNGGSTGSGVIIRRSGPERATEVQRLTPPDGPGFTSTVVPSTRQTYVSGRSLALALLRFDDLPAVPMAAQVAGIDITEDELTQQGGTALATAGVRAVLHGAWITLAAVVILLFSWAVGRSLDPRRRATVIADVVRMGAGFALLTVVANTLAYLIPARLAGLAVGAAGLILVLVRWTRRRPPDIAVSLVGLTRACLWVVPATVAAFWPLVMWGGEFVGRFKTDLFEYATLASIAADNSLFAMQDMPLAQSSGTLTSGAGISWRSIDSIAASALSLVPGVTTVQAFTLLGLILFLIWGMAAIGLATSAGGGRWHRAAVGLALFAPLFAGLYVENYFSQYFFVALIPLFLLSLAAAVADDESSGLLRAPEVAAAAVAAAMIAVYPYFCIIVLVAVIPAFLLDAQRRHFLLRRGPIMAVETLLLANLALMTVLNYGSTQVYQDGLNAIARNILLAPFGVADLLGLGVGVVPYQWRAPISEPTGWMGGVGRQIWQLGAEPSVVGVGVAILFGIVTAVVLVAIRWRESLRNPGFPGLVGIVVLFSLFATYLVMGDGVYAALKAAWTAVAVAPLIVAVAVLRPRWAPLVALVLIPVALLWLRTSILDRASYLVVRSTPVVSATGGHESLAPEVAAVTEAVSGASTVTIVKGPQPIVGSDRDRVGMTQSTVAVRDLDVECVGCGQTFDTFEDTPQCQDGTVPALVVVGMTGRESACGKSLVYRGNVIEVFR